MERQGIRSLGHSQAPSPLHTPLELLVDAHQEVHDVGTLSQNGYGYGSLALLSLSLSMRRKGSVQAPPPPRDGSRTCSSWQAETCPRDFVREGSAVLGGLSGLKPKTAQGSE